jgi:MHS family proline/betaine transporter-like MFS transporter
MKSLKTIIAILLIAIIVLAAPMMRCFVSGNLNQVIFAHILLSLIAAIYIGAEPALQCALYPSNIRNTALSLAYNLSTSIFGGTTPYIMAIMVGKTGNLNFAAIYLIACASLGLIALSYAKVWQQNKA